MLRVWNLSLVIATFCLTILGTFLTRSGVINSVHAFSRVEHRAVAADVPRCLRVHAASRSSRGGATSCDRRAGSTRRSRAKPRSCSTTCLFAGVRARRAHRHGVPVARRGAAGQADHGRASRTSSGSRVPIGLALLFLMAVGPALAVARRERRAAAPPAARSRRGSGAITLVVALLAGAHGIANVLAFALGAFTLASIGRSVCVGVRARRRAHTDEAVPTATVRTVRGNPRLYGGLLVHVGVVVIAVALGDDRRATRRDARCSSSPGRSASVRGYTVTYLGRDDRADRRRRRRSRRASTSSGIGELAPAISTYPNFADGIGTPSIHTDPLHDCVSHARLRRRPRGRVTIGVQVGTMVMWLWIGGLIMALGTIARARAAAHARRAARSRPSSNCPRRRRRTAPARPRSATLMQLPRAVDRDRRRCRARRVRRAARGAAPPMNRRCRALVQEHGTVPDVHADARSTARRSTPRRCAARPYVVNFFNSWCIPCQQEAPALQAFYDAHKNDPDFADDRHRARRRGRRGARATSTTKRSTWPVALDPKGSAALGFGTTGQPETYVIAPDGVAVCGALGRVDARRARHLARRRAHGQPCVHMKTASCRGSRSRSWWSSAIVVLVVRSRPDDSPAARAARLEHQLACPVCEGQSVADSNAPESRQIRADIPARIRGRPDPTPRSAPRTCGVRRPRAAHAVERRHRHRRVGRSRCSCSCSAASASCSRCGAGAARPGSPRPPTTKRSSRRVRERTRRGRPVTDDTVGARRRTRVPAAFARRPRSRARRGNIDADTYRVLHDDYTARAAAVIRSHRRRRRAAVRRGAAGSIDAPRASRSAASSCSASSLRSCSVTRSASAGPAGTITGQQVDRHAPIPARRSRPPSPPNPKSYDARIAYAALSPAVGRRSRRDHGVHRGGEARPKPARAAAYSGWISALRRAADSPTPVSRRRCSTVATTEPRTRRSPSIPTYPDAYVFKGLLLYQLERQAGGRRPDAAAVPGPCARGPPDAQRKCYKCWPRPSAATPTTAP